MGTYLFVSEHNGDVPFCVSELANTKRYVPIVFASVPFRPLLSGPPQLTNTPGGKAGGVDIYFILRIICTTTALAELVEGKA